jgi:predicted flap endonuclease-1-like 5' DNA nuclease
MRLDYTLYVLAALILIITAVPFMVGIQGVESDTKSLWVVTTVVLGLVSIGLGYSQRPKTEAQACQPAMLTPQAPMEAPKKEKAEVPMEKTMTKETIAPAPSMTATMQPTQVKGIGEKRATQLKALGINSVDDLANASAKTVAAKLKISPRIASKWIESAKELKK